MECLIGIWIRISTRILMGEYEMEEAQVMARGKEVAGKRNGVKGHKKGIIIILYHGQRWA